MRLPFTRQVSVPVEALPAMTLAALSPGEVLARLLDQLNAAEAERVEAWLAWQADPAALAAREAYLAAEARQERLQAMVVAWREQVPLVKDAERFGRRDWDKTVKVPFTETKGNCLVVELKQAEGRCHVLTGITASFRQRGSGLLTVQSGTTMRVQRYVHTDWDYTGEPVRCAAGEPLLVCLAPNESKEAPVGAVTLWGYTVDEGEV